MGLGSFGCRLVDGHTSALTHRSIPLSPTSGYVSVKGITDVCDEKASAPEELKHSGMRRVGERNKGRTRHLCEKHF